MMRASYILALLITAAACGAAFAQTATDEPFHFKQAYLGMPLDEFKASMKGDIYTVYSGKRRWNNQPSTKDALHYQTPICTDSARHFPGDDFDLTDGEVLCNSSPGTTNRDFLEVGKVSLSVALYRFYKNRLYRIDFIGDSTTFSVIKSLLINKYGPVSKVGTVDFQNAFGARWTAEKVEWLRPHSALLMREGAGNGPGQDPLNTVNPLLINFMDFELAPEARKKDPLNF